LDHEAGVSTAHLGIQDRDLEYEEKKATASYCLLGLVKRGKSRGDSKTQVPTRWIDQGAIEAVSIVEVPLFSYNGSGIKVIMLINGEKC
jgi:hypothetical protein